MRVDWIWDKKNHQSNQPINFLKYGVLESIEMVVGRLIIPREMKLKNMFIFPELLSKKKLLKKMMKLMEEKEEIGLMMKKEI